MKRIVHYAVLAAVLLGVPLLAAYLCGSEALLEGVKQFPPRTEDWGLHPENLWNVRRPFSWPVFLGMAVFTLVCLFPFLRRGFRASCGRGVSPRQKKDLVRHFPWWGWSGLVLLAVSWWIAWSRFEIFKVGHLQVLLSYFPIWIGFIVSVNALVWKRAGRCPLTEHPGLYLATFPASALFWWFFEYLNRFVWNWYYLGIGDLSATEYVVYATLCFSSVLPGVYAVAELLGTFRFFDDRNCDGMARVDVRSVTSRIVLFVLSAVGLVGIVCWPDYVYPFLWISPLMVFVLVQVLLGEPSVLDRLGRGAWGLVFRFEIAALCCGFCWETWNYYALAKWVYAVPWVHAFQVWEMPLVGFAGYLPFGVECAAVIGWLYGRRLDAPEGKEKAKGEDNR